MANKTRIKLTDNQDNVSYIYRTARGGWCYASDRGIPLAFSNCTRSAMLLSFDLSDSDTEEEALAAVKRHVYSFYKVELLK